MTEAVAQSGKDALLKELALGADISIISFVNTLITFDTDTPALTLWQEVGHF
jgi:hypothetical protein